MPTQPFIDYNVYTVSLKQDDLPQTASSTATPARRGLTPSERYLAYFLVFAFASGALAHTLPAVLPVTRYTTDGLLLVLNGLLIFSLYQRNRDSRLWIWLLLAYLFTFATEAIGVATGAIFGEYVYGATMWWQWLGVPFVIALNWCALTLATNDLAARIVDGPLRTALLASVIIALYDVAIEPVAISLDYWQWADNIIPLQNYLMWAVVAFIISLPLQWLRIRYRSPLLPVYLFAQLFFFIVLNLAL
ncbi:carotenoid biosynthesis protein [Lewinella sp. IMCC34191]|uniref:carotenoid biosynthesis protein n=1 Tax=Lewinella sp. IMCC34191 TaxID=2259172 RepID=UPI000E2365D9|nr:carotenoid biosynthesis protein [Lewinella sp. IMCC34191]